MSALTFITERGLSASISENGKLKLHGLSSLPPDKVPQVVEYARTHKSEILKALKCRGESGKCEMCPAAGYWDFNKYTGLGLLCFHRAYFLGKPGSPKPCSEMRTDCPLESSN